MKKKLISMVCMMAMVFGFFTASNMEAEAATRRVKKAPTAITVIGSSNVSVTAGKKFELKVKAYPAYSNDDKIVWSIANPKVVAFEDRDRTGDDVDLVAKGAGTTTITAKVSGTKISKSFKVTVKKKAATVSKGKIIVDDTYMDVDLREWEDIEARLIGGNYKSRALTFTVANPSIATVKNGMVYGKKIGTTKITITANADKSIKKVVYVTVERD